MTRAQRERKKGYMKNYYCKRKNFETHLTNHVKDIEKFSLNKF